MTHGSHRGRAACAKMADRAAGLLRRAGAATGAASGRLPRIELVRAAIPLKDSLPCRESSTQTGVRQRKTRNSSCSAPHLKDLGGLHGRKRRVISAPRQISLSVLKLAAPATRQRTKDGGSPDGKQCAGGAAGREAQLCTGESRLFFPPALALLGCVTLLQAMARVPYAEEPVWGSW